MYRTLLVLFIVSSGLAFNAADAAHNTDIEEIKVWGQQQPLGNTNYASPSSILMPEDMVSINAATTEDLVKYEPALVIRRRFIGDPNGTMGIRGSNMFQTTRSMVFADGVPLHYFLQTRWNGSPRWSLVSADEIAQVEVIYGPFSAEYGGNAMGGVVNIETAIPTQRKIHAEGSFFNQSLDAFGFDEELQGYKGFVSYGDTFGNISVYGSYNHLDNDSQPQTFSFSDFTQPGGGEQPVTGAIESTDEFGNEALYFGNDGSVKSTMDNLKFKIGYDWNDGWSALLNIAYEKRELSTDSPDNYLETDSDERIWDGRVMQNGRAFSIDRSDFAVSEQDRQSLLLGGRLEGALTDDWWLQLDLSVFTILDDVTHESLANPRDPAFTPAGEITDFDDTGWQTAEIKLQNNQLLGSESLNLVTGYRFERYSLEINNYDSTDFANGVKTALTNTSGGETRLHAAYGQLGWQITATWDMALGGRFEYWRSKDGFFGETQITQLPSRSETRFSPKFSVGFVPDESWDIRYSLAKAYRFPIVEELFQNSRNTQGTSLADARLEPEDGLHQNLKLERSLGSGYARVNLFHEIIEDVIFSQTAIVDNRSINTFIPISEVTTRGIEFIYNQPDIFNSDVDIRFNTTYTDAEITRNRPNPAIEGNIMPRMPKWRTNLLVTWHINEKWDIGGGLRHASNSFDNLDNSDTAENVYGAQDSYTFVNLKSSYRVNRNLKLSLGLDNVFDETAYVFHPWPERTLFVEAVVDY